VTEVAGHNGVGPHGGACGKIIHAMAAKFQPLGFKHGYHADILLGRYPVGLKTKTNT
jgi:hypothetical protein